MPETATPRMSTRERPGRPRDEAAAQDDEFAFVSDADIAAYLAEQAVEDEAAEDEQKKEGFWNLQTASGMGLIGLGALYSLQQIGLMPLGTGVLSALMGVLPVLAAVLIMLTGFGVLSWSPAARRRRKARERATRLREQARKTMGRAAAGRARQDAQFAQAERVLRDAGRTAGRLAGEAARAATAAATGAAQRTRDNRRAGRRLARDHRNRKLTGVAAGLANYFGIDPTIVRMVWVALTIFTGTTAVVPYILLSFLLPKGDDEDRPRKADRDDPVVTVRVVRD